MKFEPFFLKSLKQLRKPRYYPQITQIPQMQPKFYCFLFFKNLRKSAQSADVCLYQDSDFTSSVEALPRYLISKEIGFSAQKQ